MHLYIKHERHFASRYRWLAAAMLLVSHLPSYAGFFDSEIEKRAQRICWDAHSKEGNTKDTKFGNETDVGRYKILLSTEKDEVIVVFQPKDVTRNQSFGCLISKDGKIKLMRLF